MNLRTDSKTERMKTLTMTPDLYNYVLKHSPIPHQELVAVSEATKLTKYPQMQSAPDQGAFMHVLAKLMGAKRCLEVGCFTGYSAISVASALPKDGLLVAMDIDPETAAIARKHAEHADLGHIIDIRLAPAIQTLNELERTYGAGSFDMAFIDADKSNYDVYYEACLKLVRRGGAIIIDNVIWSGKVLDTNDNSPDTKAIRTLNDKIANDPRVDKAMLHISDGVYILHKR